MSNVLKLSGPLKVGSLSAPPSNPQEGCIYFDTSSGTFQMYQSGGFREIDVEAIQAHLTNDANIKHDANEVDYQRVDGSRKNIQADATSPHVEAALSDLDDAIGALDQTPTNYTPADPGIVADHLAAIDSELGNINITPEFSDSLFRIQDNGDASKEIAFEASGISAATTRTITMPDEDVDLGLISTAIQSSEKGANNGVATLDGGGKVPVSQLPSSVMTYEGVWNASTNSPTLADGVGDAGQVYRVSVAGTQDLGSGNISFEVGDYVIYNGSVWEKSDTTDAVASVNGQTGVVSLDTDDISEGSTNLYFTDARAKAAAVEDAIADGVTDVAPSQNAVFDALATKLESIVEDTTPQLGGDLDVNGNAIEDADAELLLAGQNSVRRAKQASKSSFVEEEYIHATSLLGSQTNTTIAALTFAFASYEAVEITYKIRQTSTNNVRVGTIRVVTNGTAVVINDVYTDSADLGISFSAAINGSNIEIRYTSGTNGGTMRMDVKKFLT